MRKFTIILAIASLFFMLASCAPKQQDDNIPDASAENIETSSVTQIINGSKISPEEAKAMIGGEGVILLDVRTKEEYEEQHITGSLLLPLDDIELSAEAALPDKEKTIIIYCRSGRRSAIAAEQIISFGYKKVYDLGGIQSWPYETVAGSN